MSVFHPDQPIMSAHDFKSDIVLSVIIPCSVPRCYHLEQVTKETHQQARFNLVDTA